MPPLTQTTLTQHLTLTASRVPAGAHTRLPQWLGNASSARRETLKNTRLEFADWQADTRRQQQAPLQQAMAESWATQNQLDTALAALQAPQAFAAPLLQQGLTSRFGIELDVTATYLRLYAPVTVPLFPVDLGGVKAWTVSLVDAALHNFDAAEGEKAAYTTDSTFITQPSAAGQFDTLPAVSEKISIAQFVGLCRELDIGAQYQRYLKGFFGFQNATLQASLRSKVIANLKAEAQTCVHMARLKKDASESTLRTLQAQLDGLRGLTLQGKVLLNHDLSLMGAPLTGIVLFAADLEQHRSAVPIVAYIPGDPLAPLKYYPDGTAFMRDLADKLRDADYQAFFSRFVNQEYRGYFFADLNSRLSKVVWHSPQPGDSRPAWRDEPVVNPNLQFYATKITGDLYEHLYETKLDKLLNDARVTAISTADADSKARWQRWDIVQKVANAILEVAAFIVTPFLPPLGALMLGYTAYQLLDDVFEGIIDWAEGLKREAFGHLMSILEQMVQLGMFAVGAPIAEDLLRQALPNELWRFFERLTPVTTDGKTRLWKPDLAPYTHDIQLPPESRPNHEGLYAHADKQILTLNGRHFSIKQQLGNTFLAHPTRAHAYRPQIISNGKGAWLTATDRPLTWDRSTLLRRLGPPADTLSETRLEWAHRISGADDAALRKLHMDRQPPPPLLADTLKRVAIDQQLQDFIDQMNSDDPAQYQKADPQTQLWLLSQTGLWPESKTLRFLNAKGETVWEHKGQENSAVAQIHEAQMKNGDFLKTLLETLDESERKILLEEEFGTPATQLHVRAAKLRKQLARQAQAKRASLFDSRYRGLETTDDPRLQKIIDSAPGLPTSAAHEVLFGASGQDLLAMDQGSLPTHLVERARWAAHQVRISRAYEGLYMDALESNDTEQLALHSLEKLPGWSPQVRLEVRDFSRTGTVRDTIGPLQAPIQRTLVRAIDGGYVPEDGKGTLFGETDLYTAVLQALPDAQRDALGIHIGQGPLLKQTLRQYALAREPLGELLATAPVRKPFYDPKLMRLPGGMEGYDASAPGNTNNLEALLVHELYPRLAPAEVDYVLNAMRSHPGSPLQTLHYLKAEFSRLETDLATWRSNLSQTFLNTEVPLFSSTVAEEKLNRWIWTHQLLRAWRHETPEDGEFSLGRQLHLDAPLQSELPTISANFDHICNLRLKGYPTTQGVPAFLAHFPNLRTLDISDIALNTLPPEVMARTQLNRLTLSNCNLNLTTQSRAQLATLSQLRSLDLSRNYQLSLSPNLGQMPELQTLNLSQTHISLFPEHLINRPQLTSADLSGNYLSRLPDALFSLPAERARAFDLSGNPLSRATLEKIKRYCQRTGEHFGADANPFERRLVHELYPTFTDDEANNFIFRLPGELNDSMPALLRLKTDYERLQTDLQEWALDIPERYPFIDTPMDEGVRAQQQLLRHQLKALLEESWRRETGLDSSQEPPTTDHEMALKLPLLGDLPVLNMDFKHVSKLELSAEQATSIPEGFLVRFPNLETLHIHRYALPDIPADVFKLTKLKTLILSHSRMRLTATSADALSDLQNLEYLDLSGNPLGITPDVSKMSGLSTLIIENAGLTEVPNGTFNLPSLDQLDLRNNRITELPTDLLEVAPDRADGFVLGGNTFSPETIALLVPYYNRTGVDFGIPEVRQRAQLSPASSTDVSEEETEQ
ncbi:leucine-rich repeat domain-containing protein [Pseudomonas edaphica]|uniref:Leucine-rich repeat domain-containing protein n=2 Tax=Gammaproteobacteria TaxID=1236 RepID=A0A7Y8E572_9PSED|nr:leucine-rich repeat domain-containing protein [Pseudomonas sp. IPO3747]NWE08233.1 leucine-rich repeat domain-containing protein [Pseudomonas edaphica]NWE83307.1 leucine-rich repeat domain-containing protein [Pseudomonas edaphica]